MGSGLGTRYNLLWHRMRSFLRQYCLHTRNAFATTHPSAQPTVFASGMSCLNAPYFRTPREL
eukprot:6482719-Amphidinium_carterae.2